MMENFPRDPGYDVRVAPHGRAALKLIREQRPDILISDYTMLLMTGAELAAAIRSEPKLKDMPILLVSGAQAHLARGRADLFDATLDRPCTPTQLLTAILAWFGTGQDEFGEDGMVPRPRISSRRRASRMTPRLAPYSVSSFLSRRDEPAGYRPTMMP
jgi:CheY-like chemotaxis protein